MMMELPIRILVVDDDVDTVRGTCRVLEQAGYETLAAQTGGVALALVQAGRPQLVLLDRQLPDLDGLEVCRRIKSDPALIDTCVIIVSAQRTLSDDQAFGLESGADGYIARPVGNRELLARVETFLRGLRKGRSLREKAEALLQRRAAGLPPADDDETRRLLYELQIHQAELEIQSEALRRAQGELELSRDQYARLYDNAPVGYVLLDRLGLIRQANRTVGELLGRASAELVGQPLVCLFTAEDRDGFPDLLRTLWDSSEDRTFEARWTRADGSVRWVELRGRPESRDVPQVVAREPRLLMTISDVSERKASEQRLDQLNAALQMSNQELERFNRLLVGRELRMIELKQEVNELCQRRNLTPRYAVELSNPAAYRDGLRSEDKP